MSYPSPQQSASTNQNWFSALGKSVSDAVKSVMPHLNNPILLHQI